MRGIVATVIVVDNASSDNSVIAISSRFPDAVMLCQRTNLGFVGGVNAGLEEVVKRRLDFAWLVNDDTYVENHVLLDLVKFASLNPARGLYSPVIRNAPSGLGNPQFANGLVDWNRVTIREHLSDDEFDLLIEQGATPVLIGTALFCDARVLARIGLLDTRFFAYWEDIDFSVRAAKAGFEPSVAADVTVLHDAPAMLRRAPDFYYYMLRNEALFWQKHSKLPPIRWRLKWLAKCFVRLVEHRALGQQASVRACVDAIWDAVRNRYGSRTAHPPAPRWFLCLATVLSRLFESLLRGQIRTWMKKKILRS